MISVLKQTQIGNINIISNLSPGCIFTYKNPEYTQNEKMFIYRTDKHSIHYDLVDKRITYTTMLGAPIICTGFDVVTEDILEKAQNFVKDTFV